MSTLLRARRPFGVSAIASGADSVIAGVWLPSGSILTLIKGIVKINGSTELLLNQAAAYGLEIWILPLEDPDSGVTMNALWDSHVPKDTLTDVLDLDSAGADANPFYEPGQITWEFLIDIGLQPRRLLHRHKIMSSAADAMLMRQDEETPFLEHWFPGSVETVSLNRSIRVREPSLVVAAVSVPDTTATSTTAPVAAFNEEDWGRVKYIDNVLEMAMMDLLGLTEAGATTPWEEASALLRTYLDPLLFETNAGTFVATTLTAIGELVFDIVVPGRMPTKILTGGR